MSEPQKSTAIPLRSQSPYRTGSGPSRPPSSFGRSISLAFLRRSSASAKARMASGGRIFGSDKIGSFYISVITDGRTYENIARSHGKT